MCRTKQSSFLWFKIRFYTYTVISALTVLDRSTKVVKMCLAQVRHKSEAKTDNTDLTKLYVCMTLMERHPAESV